MEQDLAAAFKKSGYIVTGESAKERIGNILTSLDRSAQWGAQHYEIFLASRDYSREVTLDLAEAFEEFAKQESRKERKTRISFADQNVAPNSAVGLIPQSAKKLKTPGKHANTPLKPAIKLPSTSGPTPGLASTPAAISSFQARKDKGKVVSCFNEDLNVENRVRTPAEEIAIRTIGEAISPSQTFMVDRLSDKVAYLDQRIMDFAKAVEASEKVSLEHPVNVPSQEDVWVVGRVCCEDENRLTEGTVMLEGSNAHSQGNRVYLDLSRVESYSVFPGQIIAARGVNANGSTFTAKQLISTAPLPTCENPEGRGNLSMVVAAGPFSFPTSVRCEALEDLLDYCRESKPDVLVLLGPYVDCDHPLIENGQEDQTHQGIFEEWVIGRLMGMGCGTMLVVLPAVRDVHHWPVFPQPALQAADAEGIFFLDNPAMFSCQNCSFGIVTSEVLLPLSAGELKRGAQPDRMASLAAKIIQQGSFFPIFPPPLGTCLDTTLARHLKLQAVPDILVLPSDLNSFAKLLPVASPDSEQCLCINPGKLVKGHGGGTFAHIHVLPGPQGQKLSQSCKVEIKKL